MYQTDQRRERIQHAHVDPEADHADDRERQEFPGDLHGLRCRTPGIAR